MLSLLLAATLLVPGPERMLTPAHRVPAAGAAAAAIAANGNEAIVTWVDNGAVFGARLSRDGTPFEPAGVPLGIPWLRNFSVLTPVGDHFLAFWSYPDFGSASIDASLNVTARHTFDWPPVSGWPLGFASSGQTALVLMPKVGRLLGADGAPLSNWFPLAYGYGEQVALVADDEGYLVFFFQSQGDWKQGTLYAQRVSTTGAVFKPQPVLAGLTDFGGFAAARAGDRDVVVWTGFAGGVSVVTIDPATLTMDSSPLFADPQVLLGITGRSGAVTIAHAPVRNSTIGSFSVATVDLGSRRIVADVPFAQVDLSSVRLTATGDQTLIAFNPWETPPRYGVFVAALSGSSAVGPPRLVSYSAPDQSAAEIADGTSVRLAVWTELDTISGSRGVRAVRVDSGGSVVDRDPIDLSDHADGSAPIAVAFDGSHFIATWSEGGARVAHHIDEQGRLLEAQPYSVPGTYLSCGDGQCLVSDANSVLFLSPSGTAGPRFEFTSSNSAARVVAHRSVFGGGVFAVSLTQSTPIGPARDFVRPILVLVPEAGNVRPQVIQLVDPSVTFATGPAIGWNGSEFLAVWTVEDTEHYVVHAARIAASGEVLQRAALDTPDLPLFVRDPRGVAFIDGSWAITFASSVLFVSPSLNVESSMPLGEDPVLSARGVPLVIYNRVAPEYPLGGARRLFVRSLDGPGVPKRRAVGH